MKRTLILLMFLTNTILPGAEVRLIKKIPLSQDETFIFYAGPFSVTEDETFILADVKNGDFKLYDNTGNIIKIWGKRGPGPDEFGVPAFCDYQKSYFSFIDLKKRKIFVYKTKEDKDFEKVKEILCPSLATDIKLKGDKVLVSGFIRNSKGNKFELYMKDLKNQTTSYLLPAKTKYGFKSKGKYKEIAPIGISGFCDFEGDTIYFVWEGNLRIIRINLKTKEIDSFGEQTKNYIKPKATSSLTSAYNKLKKELIHKEKRKMSYVIGVFADKDVVGLIYSNFNKALSIWQMTLQLYSPNGELLKEIFLPEARNYDDTMGCSFFYIKEKKLLYFLSRELDSEFQDALKILKYKIQ
jgi:hypothetical protein